MMHLVNIAFRNSQIVYSFYFNSADAAIECRDAIHGYMEDTNSRLIYIIDHYGHKASFFNNDVMAVCYTDVSHEGEAQIKLKIAEEHFKINLHNAITNDKGLALKATLAQNNAPKIPFKNN